MSSTPDTTKRAEYICYELARARERVASTVWIYTPACARAVQCYCTHTYIVVKLRFGITRAVFKKNTRIMIRNAKSFATLAYDIDVKNDLMLSLSIFIHIHDLDLLFFAIDIN